MKFRVFVKLCVYHSKLVYKYQLHLNKFSHWCVYLEINERNYYRSIFSKRKVAIELFEIFSRILSTIFYETDKSCEYT